MLRTVEGLILNREGWLIVSHRFLLNINSNWNRLAPSIQRRVGMERCIERLRLSWSHYNVPLFKNRASCTIYIVVLTWRPTGWTLYMCLPWAPSILESIATFHFPAPVPELLLPPSLGSHHTDQITDVRLLLKNLGPSAVRRLLKLGPVSNVWCSSSSLPVYDRIQSLVILSGQIRLTHEDI